jgi:hypothetical protein
MLPLAQLRWLSLALGVMAAVVLIHYSAPYIQPHLDSVKNLHLGKSEQQPVEYEQSRPTFGNPALPSVDPSPIPITVTKTVEAPCAPTQVSNAPILPALSGYDGPVLHGGPRVTDKARSKIVKITMLYYNEATPEYEAYEEGLKEHYVHDDKFGYDHFVLRRPLVTGLWTKAAEVLHLLLTELSKPEEDRYQWIFWHDADLVLMNHNIPLEIFLPPEGPEWSHVNWIVSNDLGGLNSGIYFLRVCDWSVHYFGASLSYETFRPDESLGHEDQTAQDRLLKIPKFRNNTIHMPQRWFNGILNWGRDSDIPPEWPWEHGWFRPGDLLVHLPGVVGRDGVMRDFMNRKKKNPDEYLLPLEATGYVDNITAFWENEAKNEYETQAAFWRYYWLISKVGPQQDHMRDEAIERFKESHTDLPESDLATEIERIKEEHRRLKIQALRKAEKQYLLDGADHMNEPY